MSKCGCFTPRLPSPEDKNLNIKILGAFLADPNGGKYDHSLPNFEYIPRFSHFDPTHMKKVRRIAVDLSKKPCKDMIRVLSCLKNTYPSSVYIDHLARVALHKHPDTKFMSVPPPYQTVPSLFFNQDLRHGRLEEILTHHDTLRVAKLDPEQLLAWWREDPGFSSHHGNWHLYYPFDEAPVFERQGELFAYMHVQMLARFDFERLALGFSRVEPFGPGFGWDKPMKYGYNPRLVGFSARAGGMMIPHSASNGGRRVFSLDIVRQTHELLNGIDKGFLINSQGRRVPVSMNALGLCLEANLTHSTNHQLYGDIHNNGHVLIAYCGDPDGVWDIDKGAMMESFTAARDPVFYRWHKFIDIFFENHRRSLRQYTVNDWAALKNVEIRSFKTIIDDKDAVNLPAHFDLTNNLFNYMGKETITIYDPEPKEITDQGIKKSIPFSFKLNVRNNGKKDAKAVFRVFMVPYTEEPHEVWRLLAVELDRFVVPLKAGEDREIVRSDKDSSVILPPELTVGHIMQGKTNIGSKPPCGCGWPRNLLIPRGQPTGMKTKIYVLASNWAEDGVNPEEGLIGSIAYCGKLGGPYPDKRPMGFPFDRNTTWGETQDKSGREYMPEFDEAIIDKVPNAAMAEVTVTYITKHMIETEEAAEAEKVKNKEFFQKSTPVHFSKNNFSTSEGSSSDSDDDRGKIRKSLSSLQFFYG